MLRQCHLSALTANSDLGQNLKTGNLKDSVLARVYAKARSEPAVEDFAYYEPLKAYASFVATPLFDELAVISARPFSNFVSKKSITLSKTVPVILPVPNPSWSQKTPAANIPTVLTGWLNKVKSVKKSNGRLY
jgi:hypothetical protein